MAMAENMTRSSHKRESAWVLNGPSVLFSTSLYEFASFFGFALESGNLC